MIRIIGILVFACLTFSACTDKSANAIADRLQNSPSIRIPGIGEINTVSAEGNDLIFATDASARCLNYEIIKNGNLKYMIGDNALVAIFSLGVGDDLLDSNVSLVFRFQWDDGKRIDVRFSPSELKARQQSISKRFSSYK